MALSRHFADGVETVVFTDANGKSYDATPRGLPELDVAAPAKPPIKEPAVAGTMMQPPPAPAAPKPPVEPSKPPV